MESRVFLIRIFPLLLAMLAGCGKPLDRPRKIDALVPNQPILCSSPLSAQLTRVSPPASVPTIPVGTPVSYQVSASGGCSASFVIEGNGQPFSSGYVFTRSYPSPGTFEERVRVHAAYADGTTSPTYVEASAGPVTIVSSGTGGLICDATPAANLVSVPVNGSGQPTTPYVQSPTRLRLTKNGVSVNGRVTRVTSLGSPNGLGAVSPIPNSPADIAGPFDIAIEYRALGIQTALYEVASGVDVGYCTGSVNAVAATTGGAATILSFTASASNPLPYGSRVILQWSAIGVSVCQLSGSKSGTIGNFAAQGSYPLPPLTQSEDFTLLCGSAIQSVTLQVLSLLDTRIAQIPPGTDNLQPLQYVVYGGFVYKTEVAKTDKRVYYNSISATDAAAAWRGWTILPGQASGYTSLPIVQLLTGNVLTITAFSDPQLDFFTIQCNLNGGAFACGGWN